MRESKKRRLEGKGWKVGSAAEFLDLSAEEAAYVDLKLKLATSLRARRERLHLTQGGLARIVRSSQSRIAKMEVGDRSVSIDLLIRTLLALGATNRSIARIIAPTRRATAA